MPKKEIYQEIITEVSDKIAKKIRLSGISRGRFLLKESICYPYF